MENLDGKTILITGAAQGLGFATAETLALEGAHIVLTDVKKEALEKAAKSLTKQGLLADAHVLDVTDEGSISTLIDTIVTKHGKLDALVNNAGVDVTKSIDELEVSEFDFVTKINFRAPFIMTKYAFEVMKKQKGGSIVNIASTAAKRAWDSASVYHATKWGLLGFSHAAHVEGRKYGIKVTAVIAGGMRTPFILERFPDVDPSVLQDPKNVANSVKFALMQPAETVISEMMVLPVKETSWP